MIACKKLEKGIVERWLYYSYWVLYKGNTKITIGKEQIQLQNRSSFKSKINGLSGAVYYWDAASTAITSTGAIVSKYSNGLGYLNYICSGGTAPDMNTLNSMLNRVKIATSVDFIFSHWVIVYKNMSKIALINGFEMIILH